MCWKKWFPPMFVFWTCPPPTKGDATYFCYRINPIICQTSYKIHSCDPIGIISTKTEPSSTMKIMWYSNSESKNNTPLLAIIKWCILCCYTLKPVRSGRMLCGSILYSLLPLTCRQESKFCTLSVVTGATFRLEPNSPNLLSWYVFTIP